MYKFNSYILQMTAWSPKKPQIAVHLDITVSHVLKVFKFSGTSGQF